ncbi:MAG: bestrophin family ion channel [Caldimonas sp.]
MIVLERPNGLQLFFTLKGSVLPRIVPSIAICTAMAVLVTLSHGSLFKWKVMLTPVPFSLIGLALAIFLGFRNGAAYERFWEARKLWGDVVHRSRTLARQVATLLDMAPEAVAVDARTRMIRRAIAFAHALRHQLRRSDPSNEMAKWLDPSEAAEFESSRLGTDYLLRRQSADIGRWLRTGSLTAPIAAEMDKSLAILAAAQAGCERIQTTPIPFAYTLLLHRTAFLYCFLLPFGLVDTIGFMTPFVVAIVAYTFFGLDALGDEIEHPFGMHTHHLPLDAICRTIEINLLETSGEQSLPDALEPVDDRLS